MKRAILAALCLASAVSAQSYDPAQPPMAPGVIGAPAGAGAHPAVAEARADMPLFTFYRPAKLPRHALPLVLWGNGGCRDNGLSASHFLREIASHGYYVIAVGRPRVEYPVAAAVPPPVGAPPPGATPDETQTSQLVDALDWATAETRRKGGPLYGRIDTGRSAVMGHSCGGLQALSMASDKRIKTAVIYNSGVYVRPLGGRSGVRITKDDLSRLHSPVAYIIGGPGDIAYPNAADDVERINHVPLFYGNLPVGHGGTFRTQPDGGEWAQVGTAWLDWQLKGDRRAARWFTGPDCGLCTDKRWTVVRKNFGN